MTTTNEVVEVKNEIGKVEDPRKYNRNMGDDIISISIKCKRVTANKGNKFNSVKGLMYIMVAGEDGKLQGRKNRWLDVHFTKDAFKNKSDYVEASSADDLSTGTLYVRASDIQAPSIYKVSQKLDDDKKPVYNDDGTAALAYPQIWIKGGIVGFEKYVVNQSAFSRGVDESYMDATVDEETGEINPVTHEDDDEPVEL